MPLRHWFKFQRGRRGVPCTPPRCGARVAGAVGAIDAVLAQALLLAFCEAVFAQVPIQVPAQVPAQDLVPALELLSRAWPHPAAAAAPTTPLRRAAPASPLADAHRRGTHRGAR